jgi:acetone carboxylase gamma subunit
MPELADSESYVHEYLILVRDDDGAHLHCASCRTRLCAVSENYRRAAKVVDTPIDGLGALFGGMDGSIDEKIVFRAYHCPSCGRRLDAEVCPAGADALWDLQLAERKQGK